MKKNVLFLIIYKKVKSNIQNILHYFYLDPTALDFFVYLLLASKIFSAYDLSLALIYAYNLLKNYASFGIIYKSRHISSASSSSSVNNIQS
jgi:hypothetical protein